MIPIPTYVLVIIIILITGLFFRMNMNFIKSLSLAKSKMLISFLICVEIVILFGSRLIIPYILKPLIKKETFIYNLADLVLFMIIIFVVFWIDRIFKNYIIEMDGHEWVKLN